MLWWLLVFSTLGLGAWGDSSWDKTQDKHLSKGLQDLLGNISQLIEKDKRGLSGVSTMVSREQWGADAIGCCAQLALPVDFLVTHHVPGLECHNQTLCSQRLRELQGHHVRNGWCDVAYNFLVGDDGRVYEGVGWNVQGVHTQGYNNISLGLAFFGSSRGHSPSPAALAAMEGLISSAVRKGHLSPLYVQPLLVKGESCLSSQQNASLKEGSPPNAAALEAAKNLIQCSVIKGHLVSDYLLVGHSDVTNVLSPGRALYNVIKTWPHFRH